LLDSSGIIHRYQQFMEEFEHELRAEVIERAKKVSGRGGTQRGTMDIDLAALPEGIGLKELY
jgi:hypothetical protein